MVTTPDGILLGAVRRAGLERHLPQTAVGEDGRSPSFLGMNAGNLSVNSGHPIRVTALGKQLTASGIGVSLNLDEGVAGGRLVAAMSRS